jgi:hypothetical protein
MKVIIATRSRNAELYAKASAFWPAEIQRERITGMDTYQDALNYLHRILNLDADLVVNIDEDCFVFDWTVVDELVRAAWRYSTGYVGMPDTKHNCHHRSNSNRVMNPFFNIFNTNLCLKALARTPWYAHAVLTGSNPRFCFPPEPFNNLFVALKSGTTSTHVYGMDHPDGISTELNYQYRPFALHSWYSREYEGAHHERINALHDEARDRCTLP